MPTQKNKELLSQVLLDAKARGEDGISVDELEQIIKKIVDEPTAYDIEYYKAKIEEWRLKYTSSLESNTEAYRATLASSQAALRSAILLNGGASVALLAFIGNVWGDPELQLRSAGLAKSLFLFTSGVLFAAVASGLAYMTQCCYQREQAQDHESRTSSCDTDQIDEEISGDTLRGATVGLVIISYVLFFFASMQAYNIFSKEITMASPDQNVPIQPLPTGPDQNPREGPVPNTTPAPPPVPRPPSQTQNPGGSKK